METRIKRPNQCHKSEFISPSIDSHIYRPSWPPSNSFWQSWEKQKIRPQFVHNLSAVILPKQVKFLCGSILKMKLKMNLKMSRKWTTVNNPKCFYQKTFKDSIRNFKNFVPSFCLPDFYNYAHTPVVCTYLNFCHNAWKDADLQLNLFARMAQRASRTSTIHITHVSWKQERKPIDSALLD